MRRFVLSALVFALLPAACAGELSGVQSAPPLPEPPTSSASASGGLDGSIPRVIMLADAMLSRRKTFGLPRRP